MSLELARQAAAQAWCTDQTKHMTMIPELAFAFADILEGVWSKPWLGNATTEQLLEEVRTRIKLSGGLDYKTVSCEQQDSVVRNGDNREPDIP